MVHPDSKRRAMFAADIQQSRELLASLGMVRVEVAWIDADFLHVRSHCDCGGGGEMNVSDKGSVYAFGPQDVPYLADALHFAGAGNSYTDDLGSGGGKTAALGHRGGHIVSVSIAHCLDNNFVITTYNNVSYVDFQ